MLHTVLFCTMPIEESCETIVAYIDLETNSLDVLSGDILEIGALIDGSRSMFSTVINPGHGASADDPSVHGIQSEELRWGPCFQVAFEESINQRPLSLNIHSRIERDHALSNSTSCGREDPFSANN